MRHNRRQQSERRHTQMYNSCSLQSHDLLLRSLCFPCYYMSCELLFVRIQADNISMYRGNVGEQNIGQTTGL